MLFQFFPFSNAHQLNLDWILEELKTFPHTVNGTGPDENGNINLPQISGMSSWNEIGADGSGNVDPLEIPYISLSYQPGLHFYKYDVSILNIPPNTTEGLVISMCDDPADTGVQIAFPSDLNTIFYRTAAARTWSAWSPIDQQIPTDLSNDVIWNDSFMDPNWPRVASVIKKSGWCFARLAGRSLSASQYAQIASNLPIPDIASGVTGQGFCTVYGHTDDIRAFQIYVNNTGVLSLNWSGGSTGAQDTLDMTVVYPCQ